MHQFLLLLKPTHRIFVNSKFNDSKSFSVICNYNPYDKIKSWVENEIKNSLKEDIIYSNEIIPNTTHYIRIKDLKLNKIKMISVLFPSYSSEEIVNEIIKLMEESG